MFWKKFFCCFSFLCCLFFPTAFAEVYSSITHSIPIRELESIQKTIQDTISLENASEVTFDLENAYPITHLSEDFFTAGNYTTEQIQSLQQSPVSYWILPIHTQNKQLLIKIVQDATTQKWVARGILQGDFTGSFHHKRAELERLSTEKNIHPEAVLFVESKNPELGIFTVITEKNQVKVLLPVEFVTYVQDHHIVIPSGWSTSEFYSYPQAKSKVTRVYKAMEETSPTPTTSTPSKTLFIVFPLLAFFLLSTGVLFGFRRHNQQKELRKHS